MALNRRRTEDGKPLLSRISEISPVVDCDQTGLAISLGHVDIVLIVILIDRNAFEDQVVVIVRCNRRWLEHGVLDPVFRNAVFDHTDFDMEPARHLNATADGAFAVALGVFIALVVPRLWPKRRSSSSWA